MKRERRAPTPGGDRFWSALGMTLPTFLVIGAQRAGTTLLHRILGLHPDVYVPCRRKEIHYFDWYFERGPEWYSGFFPAEREARQYRAIGEATPDYLFDARALGRIRALLPDCRFVVSLRNPIDRASSRYLFCLRSVNEQRGPEEFFRQETERLKRGFGRVAKLVEIGRRGHRGGKVGRIRRRGQGRWVSARGSASRPPGAW